jgi:hypothetical protein
MRSPPDFQGLYAVATVMISKSPALTGYRLPPTKIAVSWNVERWPLSRILNNFARKHSYIFLELNPDLDSLLDALSLVHIYVSVS